MFGTKDEKYLEVEKQSSILPITSDGLLELSSSRKRTHYEIVWISLYVFILFLAAGIYYYFQDGNLSGFKKIYPLLIFAIVAVLFFFFNQRRKLKFQEIKTNLSQQENFKIARNLVTKLNWFITVENKYFIEAHNQSGEGRTWGEMITILINEGNIKINSICEVDNVRSQAFFDFGKNRENIEDFKYELIKNSKNFGEFEEGFDKKSQDKLTVNNVTTNRSKFEHRNQIVVSEVSEVYKELKEHQKNESFAVFIFDGGNGMMNLQFSIEQGEIGFDYILLAPGNIADENAFLKFAESESFDLEKVEMNKVEYYRTENGDLVGHCTRTMTEFYGLELNQDVEFLIEY